MFGGANITATGPRPPPIYHHPCTGDDVSVAGGGGGGGMSHTPQFTHPARTMGGDGNDSCSCRTRVIS
eukprot:519542-Pyramimonas_sp.AAC.1